MEHIETETIKYGKCEKCKNKKCVTADYSSLSVVEGSYFLGAQKAIPSISYWITCSKCKELDLKEYDCSFELTLEIFSKMNELLEHYYNPHRYLYSEFNGEYNYIDSTVDKD